MNVDITRLKSGLDECASFSFCYSFSKKQLEKTSIIKLDNVKISGKITSGFDQYHLIADIKGTMVLPCSITLKPTNYPFSIEIDDDFSELLEENIKNDANSIDIFPIIWENILMEIPLRVVNDDVSDVKLKGDGWQFITNKEDRINPELEKLKELL